MEGDIFATKGTEYLLVIAYFVLLVGLVRLLAPDRRTRPAAPPVRAVGWFRLADGYHFHPGHAWASPTDDGVLKVGIDDFTAQLVGEPDEFALPAVGERLRQGANAWQLRTGDRSLDMLSPVEGEVVAVNDAVRESPRLAADDPYGSGWLLKVRVSDRASLRNLLSGSLAAAWIRDTAERLRGMPGTGLGLLMTDGGTPVRGFGRSLGPEEWNTVARDFFRIG